MIDYIVEQWEEAWAVYAWRHEGDIIISDRAAAMRITEPDLMEIADGRRVFYPLPIGDQLMVYERGLRGRGDQGDSGRREFFRLNPSAVQLNCTEWHINPLPRVYLRLFLTTAERQPVFVDTRYLTDFESDLRTLSRRVDSPEPQFFYNATEHDGLIQVVIEGRVTHAIMRCMTNGIRIAEIPADDVLEATS